MTIPAETQQIQQLFLFDELRLVPPLLTCQPVLVDANGFFPFPAASLFRRQRERARRLQRCKRARRR